MNLFWKCTVVVGASITQSLGLTLQRASHDEVSLHNAPRAARLWRTGIALFITANIAGSTVQLAVLPLALVCTLQAVGLVANAAFAALILHEILSRRAVWGTVLVVVGAVLVAGLGGVRSDPDVSLDELLFLFTSPRFLVWFLASLAVISGSIWCACFSKRASLWGYEWGVAAGVASAHSLLMAKLVVSLLVRDSRHLLADLVRPQLWLFGVMFAFFALLQMWCVNRGLQRASTSVLYPLVFCIYNLTTQMNGVTLYGFDAMFDPAQIGYVFVGTPLLIVGVLLLSTRLEEPVDPELNSFPDWLPRHEAASSTGSATASLLAGAPLTATPDSAAPPTPPSPPPPRPGRLSRLNTYFGVGALSPAAPGGAAAPSTPGTPTAAGSLHGSMSSPPSPLLTGPGYTSFDSISPGIANPDKGRSRHTRVMLSREQQQMLKELGMQ